PARPFRCGEVPDTLTAKAPESKGYALVYDLDLAKLGANPAYDVDHHTQVGKFDRVAYFLELQKPGAEVQYVYVSMDAFTDDLTRIGIPTVLSKANFQQPVANATVASNVAGIVGGTGLATCNIEFWPNNYGPANTSGVANASTALWDFGDQCVDPVDGYGCMQVHNFGARQTLFAINQWKGGAGADIGIGNSSGTENDTRDWTFARNAGQYSLKRLRVLVREVK
ncbi:MAG: 9-O-acetylesterase, partial [Armatimonadetes bacterium]|nr:9-O-acetylesterase [Armatimonadota bacterium]